MPPEEETQQEVPLSADIEDEQSTQAIEPDQPYALIVEDTLSNFLFVAQVLTKMGFHCEWNSTGRYVIELAEGYPRIDLIVLDIRLPHEDGFSIIEKIRASEKVRNVPVLGITAYASDRQLKKAKSVGFNGYLAKPLDNDRFEDQINQILAGAEVWEI